MDSGVVFLLFISMCVLAVMMFLIILAKNKTQLHYIFLILIIEAIIWVLFVFLEVYLMNTDLNNPFILQIDYLTYTGICTLPVQILLTGRAFAYSKIKIDWKTCFLFVIPAITMVILFTGDPFHIFYAKYSFLYGRVDVIYGWYFYVHSVYSYTCLAVGFCYLVFFSIKNTGILSKQALLIITGTAVPVIINILATLGIGNRNFFFTPISFTVAIIFYMFAMFKFNFMKITPVALKTVVNRISDSFVVVDERLNIIDFNKSFADQFGALYAIKQKENLYNLIKVYFDSTELNADAVFENVLRTKETNSIVKNEIRLKKDKVYDKYFEVEFTPVFAVGQYVATIILLKDITQRKKDFDTIQENQAIMMEKERLISLGELVGGIAHNLKTPILSTSGALEQLDLLIQEYDKSVGDPEVTKEDHHEIAGEMVSQIRKIKTYIAYMSDVISTVKDQAVKLNSTIAGAFTLHEVIHRVDILMKYELIRTNCSLLKEINVDDRITIKGDVNSLVQVFDNIIVNSIHAYKGQKGRIILRVTREDNNIVFALKDYAGGVDKNVVDSLFKKMVTTKGKNGTGIGLYMSYSTIKGMFRGNMWFESQENVGTEFFISIPMNEEGELLYA
jgi:Histidine kinase-, DNA gyrase B-, and HSP90-like ATPase.